MEQRREYMSKEFVFHKDAVAENVAEGTVRRILAYSDQLMVCELCFTKGAASDSHSHPHDQITYVVKGAMEFVVGDKRSVVRAGDTVYMPGGVAHCIAIVLEDSMIVDTFSPKRNDFLKK
jgi:quercetin dioxygenase-like cupin family protein